MLFLKPGSLWSSRALWAGFLFLSRVLCAQDKPPAVFVAEVDGAKISPEELDRVAGEALIRIRTDEFRARKALLETLIDKLLLSKESAARGLTQFELLQIEVANKIQSVSELEARAIYDSNKSRYSALSEAVAYSQIRSSLTAQRRAAARTRFLGELGRKYHVSLAIKPPRAMVDAGGSALRGPAEAPVKIIEFADFQCPYCAQLNGTLAKLQNDFPGKVAVAFRNFPLKGHAEAVPAAENAACAAEQGKFWEMHDLLFGNQERLDRQNGIAFATRLGLDSSAFLECLESGRIAKKLAEDQRAGLSLRCQRNSNVFHQWTIIRWNRPIRRVTRSNRRGT